MRYRLEVSYDGGCFNGWQKQLKGPPTVQGALEAALAQILGRKTRVFGSGRTDAGAHALRQVAHFDSERDVESLRGLRRGLNAIIPDGLHITSIWQVPSDFHALSNVVRKTYLYRIWNKPNPNLFQRHYSLWLPKQLDLEKLNEISALLVGEHDFKSFQTRGTPVKSTVRTITQAEWRRRKSGMVEFRIAGNGFLKQMVRNLVGTLLYLERKDLGTSDLERILAAKDRQVAKATAPPHGLYLLRVDYPETLDNQCRKL